MTTFSLRAAVEADHDAVMGGLADWWTLPSYSTPEAKRERALLVPRLWLQHFARSSVVAVDDEPPRLAGFLIGFPSLDRPDETYIHFVGVRPDARKRGVGRALYQHFFELSRRLGRARVRCITSPTNDVSIGFHRAMGFSLETGAKVIPDRPDLGPVVKADYDGPGVDRVAFVRDVGKRATDEK